MIQQILGMQQYIRWCNNIWFQCAGKRSNSCATAIVALNSFQSLIRNM